MAHFHSVRSQFLNYFSAFNTNDDAFIQSATKAFFKKKPMSSMTTCAYNKFTYFFQRVSEITFQKVCNVAKFNWKVCIYLFMIRFDKKGHGFPQILSNCKNVSWIQLFIHSIYIRSELLAKLMLKNFREITSSFSFSNFFSKTVDLTEKCWILCT